MLQYPLSSASFSNAQLNGIRHEDEKFPNHPLLCHRYESGADHSGAHGAAESIHQGYHRWHASAVQGTQGELTDYLLIIFLTINHINPQKLNSHFLKIHP